MCLEPLLNKRVKANNYQEHTNEDVHSKKHSKYSGIKYSRLAAVAADDDSDDEHHHHHHDVIADDDVQTQLVGNKDNALSVWPNVFSRTSFIVLFLYFVANPRTN